MASLSAVDTLTDEEFFMALPAGFRFLPSNVELIHDYLSKYLHNQPLPRNRINKADVYEFSPDELRGRADVRAEEDERSNKVWYFFTSRKRRYERCKRADRTAGNGFWKPSTTKAVDDHSGKVIGHVTSLVYFMGTHGKHIKTNWLMQEYTLENPPAPPPALRHFQLDSALCKLYVNPNNYSKSSSANRSSQQEIVQVKQQQQIVPVLVNHQQDEYMTNECTGGNSLSQAVIPTQEFQPGPSTLQQDKYMMNDTRGSNIISQEVIPTQGFKQQHLQVYEEPGTSIFHEGQLGTASDDNLLPGLFEGISTRTEDFLELLARLSPDSNQQNNFNLHKTFQNNIPMLNPTTSNPMTFGSDQQRDAFRPSDNFQNNIPMQNPMTFGSYQQRDTFCPYYNFPNNVPMQNPTISNPMTFGSIQQRDAFCPSDYSQGNVLMQNPAKYNKQRDAFCLPDYSQGNVLMRNPAKYNQQRDAFCPSDNFRGNAPIRNPADSNQQRDTFCPSNQFQMLMRNPAESNQQRDALCPSVHFQNISKQKLAERVQS